YRHNNELKIKARNLALVAVDPIDKLRAACFKRGATGIKGLARLFHIIDDDNSKTLSAEEFEKGINEYGLGFTHVEISEMFRKFDVDRSGTISFDEFLTQLRDKNGDGEITVDDLRGVYNVKSHPKYQNGDLSQDQILKQFLDRFDTPNLGDGIITKEEFLNYYSGVSASIDSDAYFDLMMINAWKLDSR
ncbi:unnamed protein product, partial [Didymodactylos carnosus]